MRAEIDEEDLLCEKYNQILSSFYSIVETEFATTAFSVPRTNQIYNFNWSCSSRSSQKIGEVTSAILDGITEELASDKIEGKDIIDNASDENESIFLL